MMPVIGMIFGTAATLGGVYAGAAAVERMQLGPRGAIALGWFLGMAFVAAVLALAFFASRFA